MNDKRWGRRKWFLTCACSVYETVVVNSIGQEHLSLGTWQQIVFIDFDNRGRNSNIVVQIMGDE